MFICPAIKIVCSLIANGDPIPQDIPLPELSLSTDYGAAFIKMFLSLIVIVALLVITFLFLRRLVQSRLKRGIGMESIRIIERKMISPKSVLYLIEVDGQKVLIGESHVEIRRLETWKLEHGEVSAVDLEER
jgi:flagellar biogenesis protein FliO